jgi:hypothetical protein
MNPKNDYGSLYSIGYWANTKRWTQTHVRDCETDAPVCGSQISKGSRSNVLNDNSETAPKVFQWCSWGYSEYDYIECEHCKAWVKRKLIAEANSIK